MRLSDTLLLSWRQLKQRRLRSILTILAVAVGSTTIIALSAQVEGARAGIIENLGKLGPDTIIVSISGTVPFTEADVIRLRGLEGVSKVTPMLLLPNVKLAGSGGQVSLLGVSSMDLLDFLGDISLAEGNIYVDAPAPQALIGYNIAVDETGQPRYRPGQPILVQIGRATLTLSVVGVLETYGTAFLTIQTDNTVFMPIDYIKSLVRGGSYTVMLIKAINTESVDQVVELIGYAFGGRARVSSVKSLTETVIRVTSQIDVLLLGIAGTSFIAAALGTLNIMMVSVLERVREIGILKALGMKDKGVLSLYMIQGALIGFFGSSVGFVLGCALAYLLPLSGGLGRLGLSSSFAPMISPLYIGVSAATSIAVTLLSSAYPAWRASRLRPVEALRYE